MSGQYPVENHKALCLMIAPPGWIYGGFDEGFYLFQSGNYQTGFTEMCCVKEDLTKENLEFMARHKLTRTRGKNGNSH